MSLNFRAEFRTSRYNTHRDIWVIIRYSCQVSGYPILSVSESSGNIFHWAQPSPICIPWYFTSIVLYYFLVPSSQTTLKPIISLCNQTIKIMDRKTMRWHHCRILEKHNLFNFESFIIYCSLKLNFKCLYSLAPSLFDEFVTRQQDVSGVDARASVNGDCHVPIRKTSFGQTVLVRTLLSYLKHECTCQQTFYCV